MKILFLAKRCWPHVGGVETHLSNICKVLKKTHQITIITEQDDPAQLEYELHEGVAIWRIPLHADVSLKHRIWQWIGQHTALFNDAEIIHVHDVFFWLLPSWRNVLTKKIYMTFHGYEVPNPPTWKQVVWHQLAEVLTQGNLCIGDFHRQWYGTEPTFVSYGGADELRKASAQALSEKKAIFAGRLSPDTGIMQYLEAIQLLQQQHAGWSLDVYGDGPQRAACEQYVKKHHLPVKFFGMIDQVQSKYQQYSLACVSRYLAILEALAAGLPVVAQYENVIKRDYLQLTPFARWIAIHQEPAQLASAIADHSHVSHEAQRWAQAQTWQKMAKIYEDLWQK